MSLQCQKIEIKKLPFYASDITNFTSAVCAVVTEMSGSGEPIFETWANTYSANLNDSYITVNTFSAFWGGGGGDLNVNTFVYSNSANILNVNSLVNSFSSNWNSVYSSFNSISSDLLTVQNADNRYVNISGDIMSGGLSAPSLSTNNLYVAGSTINFFDESGNIIETLKSNDVENFKSNYTLTNSHSAKWEETYTNFSVQSSNNLSVYNNVNSNSGNWNYAYYTILTGGTIGGNVSVSGNLSAWTADINYIDFNSTISPPPYQEGRLFYDNQNNTLALYVDNPDVTLNIGQEMWVLGVNKTGSVIPDGTVVYLSGAQGNRPQIWPALANNELRSADTIGVVTHEIAINAEGYITTEGIVSNINTSTFEEGEVLYLSPTIPGGITNVRPTAPQHLVKIGYALNATNNGKIFVTVDNGYEIDELHNVRITNPQNNEILAYNSTSSIWVNVSAYNGTDLKSLTSNWQATYTNFSIQSANNLSVYNIVNANSATNWNYQGNDLKALSGNWENTYNTVQTYSAAWLVDNTVDVGVRALTSNWENTYNTVNSNSANWNYQGTDIKSLTSNWENTYSIFSVQSGNNLSVYNNVQTNSGNWNYQGTDIKSLTSNWESVYNSFNSQSGNNQSVYSTVNVNSASWINDAPQTLSFNSVNAELTISNGNTVSLSALSGGSSGPENDPIFTAWAQSYSANYQNTYITVQTFSATEWNYQGTDIKSLTSNWQSVFSTTNTNSANWNSVYNSFNSQSANNSSVYNTVQTNSATNWNYQGNDLKVLSGNWQNTYTTVQTNSSNWNIQPLRVSVPFSDQTSNLTTGTKYTFTWRYGSSTLSATPVDLVEAPTGSNFIIDVKKNTVSIYSTKPSIDAGETSTDTATTAAVITATSLLNGDIIAVSIDQIGATNTGKGAVITFIGTTIL